jgi:hypothetical protein
MVTVQYGDTSRVVVPDTESKRRKATRVDTQKQQTETEKEKHPTVAANVSEHWGQM